MRAIEDAERPGSKGRFLGGGMVAAIVLYLVVVLTYVQPRVSNDGLSYLGFLHRLFGSSSQGYAYQFGVGYWNAPFYLAARASAALGLGEISGLPVEDLALTVGSVVAVLLLFPVGWLLLRGLELGHAALAITLTIFGTPLFYSVLFSPYDAHAVDALAGTALAVLLLRITKSPDISLRLALGIGCLLGAMVTVRYANAALAAGVAVAFGGRRAWRPAVIAGGAAAVAFAVLFSLPALRGIPYGVTADPTHAVNAGGVGGETQFDPLVPLKMLVSLRRGLFVWTPLTLLSVIGFGFLWARDRPRRLFLTSLAVGGVALLLLHMLWGRYWWGGFGFSQRFLIGLFPLFLLGLAELLRRRLVLVTFLAVLCVGYASTLALYHYYGYQGIGEKDGVDRIADLYRSGEETPEGFLRSKVGYPIRERWSTYARIVTGR